jgi:hypothetical protein
VHKPGFHIQVLMTRRYDEVAYSVVIGLSGQRLCYPEGTKPMASLHYPSFAMFSPMLCRGQVKKSASHVGMHDLSSLLEFARLATITPRRAEAWSLQSKLWHSSLLTSSHRASR